MSTLLSVQQVLTQTGIARATLYRMIEEGMPYKQVGLRKKMFELNEVLEFMGKRKNDLISKLDDGKEYTNDEICAIFKCSTQGGMRRSHSTGALVLTSHHDDPNNAYLDYWQGDILYYTGMGMEGDQDIEFAQNKTLANSGHNGVIVYLFEVFSSGRYTYRGIVKLCGEPFQKDELDFLGNKRKVWKFPLALVNKNLLEESFIKKEQAALNRSTHFLSDKELYKRVNLLDGIAHSRLTTTIVYEYNPFVREYAKRRAHGCCQLCGEKAPFEVNEQPYLKTYHLQPLSKKGKDNVQNVAALCPNCYERMLQLRSKSDLDKIEKRLFADEEAFQNKIK